MLVKKINLAELIAILENKFPDISLLLNRNEIFDYNFNFYRASYKFGDHIIHNNAIHFSLGDGNCISIHDKSVPKNIREEIIGNENHEPFGLVIEKSLEVYSLKDDSLYSEYLVNPGNFIGAPRTLDPQNNNRSSILSYNISAGSRSAFMLQKISNRRNYQHILRQNDLDIYPPNDTKEHWKTFADIANKTNSTWSCEIIFFPRAFIDLLQTDKFAHIYIYINKIYAKSYNVRHSLLNLWQFLYFLGLKKNYLSSKYNPVYINAIKHIFMVAANSGIGLIPSINEDKVPLKTLQDFFKNFYGINSPIIMEPAYFDYTDEQNIIYLSLNHQLTMSTLSEKSTKKTKIMILDDVKYLFDSYLSQLQSEKQFHNSILYKAIEGSNFTYFHNSLDIKSTKHIISAESIIQQDPRFNCNNNEDLLNQIASSSFFAGGIVISKK